MKEYDNRKLFRPNLVPSTLSKQDFEKVYALLDVTPLEFDCGTLCGKLCCREYEPGVGYLCPVKSRCSPWRNLAEMGSSKPANTISAGLKDDVAFIMCNSDCPRDKRPVQCRTFPYALSHP